MSFSFLQLSTQKVTLNFPALKLFVLSAEEIIAVH